MTVLTPPARRKGNSARNASASLVRDVVVWWLIFFLLGAPVLPFGRAAMTIATAVVVALTWPLTLPAWAYHVGASAQLERACGPLLTSTSDLFTVEPRSPKDSLEEIPIAGADVVVVQKVSFTDVELDAAAQTTKQAGRALPSTQMSPEASRCFVLAAVLLCSGLFGQLDWQVPYQVWPYPSLVVYLAARTIYAVFDFVNKVFSS